MLKRIVPLALVLGLSPLAEASPTTTTTRGSVERHTPARSKTSRKPPRARVPSEMHHAHDDRFRAVKLALRKDQRRAQGSVQVYINGRGASLRGGFEDAERGRSSILDHAGLDALEYPAYGGGQWPELMSCVRDQFAAFDVVITDRRPASADYIMMMVGGSPALIGEHRSVAGIAPFTGSVIPGAVGFAFSSVHGGDVRGLCETVAHEIGHTLGLDHTYECSDTMSYLECGPKSFVDAPMSCGEWEPRSCGHGASWQSSHATLLEALGERAAGEPTPAAPQPQPDPQPDPIDEGDEWWETGDSDEWVDWVVWDPASEQWLSWDPAQQAWVPWVDADEWFGVNEWSETEEWVEAEEWEWVEGEEWTQEWVWVEGDCPG